MTATTVPRQFDVEHLRWLELVGLINPALLHMDLQSSPRSSTRNRMVRIVHQVFLQILIEKNVQNLMVFAV